jgi:NAD+ kinase
MRKIGLVVKDQRDALEVAKEVHDYLCLKGFKVVMDQEIDEMEVDLFLVLGGDGTILKTVSRAKNKATPILGINFGTTGFLAQVSPERWREALERVIAGSYELEERAKLEVRVREKRGSALNEAVVITSVPVEILDLRLTVDDALVQEIKADGIIISTPTGSTAYSKSCGGPIVDPRAECFVITPICPFEGGLRALVVPQSSRIEVKLGGKSSALVVIDGEQKLSLAIGETAAFYLSEEKARFIKLERDFYSKLRKRR